MELRGRFLWALVGGLGLLSYGCGGDTMVHHGTRDGGNGDGSSSSMDGGGTGFDGGGGPTDGHVRQDIGPDPDAFFAMDPPPRACFPDGGMGAPATPPGGTPDCPDDKNREGCPCSPAGMTAACWPGLRVNRNRGVCHDGMTTCQNFDEFTGRWGPCTGYVLPTPGVTRGPGACECFSMGRWAIANLSPCFIDYGGGSVYAVSTYQDSAGNPQCPSVSGGPPPTPMGSQWSTDTLSVDCAGHFRLCYTLKAGNGMMPTSSDCVVARVCTEDWYATPGMTQTLPPLPSWTGTDPACAAAFNSTGGYGEMSVQGLSVECEPVDDGSGAEYVFNTVTYCPSSCSGPSPPAMCAMCMTGGSGGF